MGGYAFQPFAEFEFRPTQRLSITAGVKDANYQMDLNQYRDNGKTVGCLGGTLVKSSTAPPICAGGAAFVTHSVDYNSVLPTLTARYRLRKNWSVYGEYAEGSVIPPSAVFDVPNAAVLTPPKPTLAKTYQTGSVLKFNRWTLDLDAYYVHFQNPYTSYIDPAANEPVFVATVPVPVDQAVTINPFNVTNLFASYTIKGESWLRGSRIGLAVNNLWGSRPPRRRQQRYRSPRVRTTR